MQYLLPAPSWGSEYSCRSSRGRISAGRIFGRKGQNRKMPILINEGLLYSSFVLYNTVLSITQRQQLEGYLAWKWWSSGSAILSDPNHPYYWTQGCDKGTLFNLISV